MVNAAGSTPFYNPYLMKPAVSGGGDKTDPPPEKDKKLDGE